MLRAWILNIPIALQPSYSPDLSPDVISCEDDCVIWHLNVFIFQFRARQTEVTAYT